MRSFTIAVLFFAGILAYSNALPQYGLGEALIDLAKELAKEDRNSTIRFGNNTVIITGVAHANANVNRPLDRNENGQNEQRPWRPNQSNGWNNGNWNNGNWNYYPGYGFWRNTPENVESIEDTMLMNEAELDSEEKDDKEEAELDDESVEFDKELSDEEDENDLSENSE